MSQSINSLENWTLRPQNTNSIKSLPQNMVLSLIPKNKT